MLNLNLFTTMDVIEKETIKEVPACEYYDHYGYGRRGNVRGIAGAGLGLT